jgi:hypothetical protein
MASILGIVPINDGPTSILPMVLGLVRLVIEKKLLTCRAFQVKIE